MNLPEQAWSIVGASIAGAEVTLSGDRFTYNGSEQKPGVIVTLNGKALDAGRHPGLSKSMKYRRCI